MRSPESRDFHPARWIRNGFAVVKRGRMVVDALAGVKRCSRKHGSDGTTGAASEGVLEGAQFAGEAAFGHVDIGGGKHLPLGDGPSDGCAMA